MHIKKSDIELMLQDARRRVLEAEAEERVISRILEIESAYEQTEKIVTEETVEDATVEETSETNEIETDNIYKGEIKC